MPVSVVTKGVGRSSESKLALAYCIGKSAQKHFKDNGLMDSLNLCIWGEPFVREKIPSPECGCLHVTFRKKYTRKELVTFYPYFVVWGLMGGCKARRMNLP